MKPLIVLFISNPKFKVSRTSPFSLGMETFESSFLKDPRTGVCDCSIACSDLLGLAMWRKEGKDWKVDLGGLSRGKVEQNFGSPAAMSGIVSPEGSRLGSPTYRITLKSFLLAQATEKFLREPLDESLSSPLSTNRPSKEVTAKVLKIIREWHRIDAKAGAALSTKNAQAYYSGVVCTKNCYEVCTKLNEIRASAFGGCNEIKRGKRGRKTQGEGIFLSPSKGTMGEDEVSDFGGKVRSCETTLTHPPLPGTAGNCPSFHHTTLGSPP